jgi:hypothetical protein
VKTASPERLKVHRRSVSLDGRPYTVLSLRPGVASTFATNRYHETWHLLTDVPGAQLLGRLFWAMAFQRHERTIVVLDQAFLVPNPFDADPSSPIAVVNSDLGPLDRSALSDLKGMLPFTTPSAGTVVLQTRGLDIALADESAFYGREEKAGWRWNEHQQRRWIDRTNGVVVVAAPPPVLRMWGVQTFTLGRHSRRGTDVAELDYPTGNGEIQVLDDFDARVSSARTARERLFPGRCNEELTEGERRQIWELGDVIVVPTREAGGGGDRGR